MRTSCINHPPNEPLIVIRRWQVELCEGNTTAAALLSYFEYWHNIKLEMQGRASRSNDIAEAHGDNRTQDESLLQFHTEEELITGIMIAKRDTIRKALGYLKDCGFISIHANPNPKYAFDKTRYFLFHPDCVNEWLNEKRPLSNIPPSKTKNRPRLSENQPRLSENQPRLSENQPAITEITPEVSPEITPENNSPCSPPRDTIALEVPVEVEILEQEEEAIATPSSETPKQLTLLDENSIPDEDKNSARRVATKNQVDCDYQTLVDLYNEYKPLLWRKCKLTSDRERTLKNQFKQLGDKLAQTMIDALKWAESDDFWSGRKGKRLGEGKKFDLDTLFYKNRAQKWAGHLEEDAAEEEFKAAHRGYSSAHVDRVHRTLANIADL